MVSPNSKRDLKTYFPKELREKIIISDKKTIGEFIVIELCIFISQIFIFFFCTLFTTNFLRSESLLLKFVDSKFKSLDVTETMIVAAGSLAMIGALNLIQRAVPNESFVVSIIDNVINQVPKLFYTLGAGFIGVVLAIIIFISNNPESSTKSPLEYFFTIVIVFLFSLIYGIGLSFLLNHKNLSSRKIS